MMKKMLFLNWLILFAIIFINCSAGEKNLIKEGQQALTGDQIENLLSGNTLKGVEKGTSWAVYYSPDGTQYGKSGIKHDKGKWWISDNKYCRQWDTWSNHKIKCTKFYIDGDKLIGVSDGKAPEETDMPVAGDIENLKK